MGVPWPPICSARQAGTWILRVSAGQDQLVQDCARGGYAVIGLSAGHSGTVPALVALIGALRQAAPASRIVLSGHALDTMPGLARLAGADAASADFDQLLDICEAYVAA